MHRLTSRAGGWPLALMLVGLGACADDPVAPMTSPSALASTTGVPTGEFVEVTVTNASGGTEVGSLRWAADQIESAGGAIYFDPSLDGDTITLGGTVAPDGPMYIVGPAKGITISGNYQHRIIDGHDDDGRVSLTNVTLTQGYSAYFGSAVRATSVYLQNSTVQDSRGPGSAIRVIYTFSASNSTVSRNALGAPAVEYGPSAQVFLDHSTVASNIGGGIGPYAYPSYTLRVYLRNSILANNGIQPNCASMFGLVYEGTNISSDWSCGEVGITVADPMLQPLAYNGGPTMTHAISHLGPAYNTGTGCWLETDQRYVKRDAKCDVGAFEFNDSTKVTITIDPAVRLDVATGRALLTGTVKCTRDDTVSLALELHQDQKVGKTVVDVHAAATATQLPCTTTATGWSRKMILTEGTWQAGAARATASTFDTPDWVAPASAASAVKISGARR